MVSGNEMTPQGEDGVIRAFVYFIAPFLQTITHRCLHSGMYNFATSWAVQSQFCWQLENSVPKF